tara:strand:+ start:1041 stop:1433 length:393 start_codon:yes stop_codon:yes gene_type:complete
MIKKIMNRLKKQIKGFIIAGISANLVSFFIYVLLYKNINTNILFASIMGQIFGILTNYQINSKYVFNKKLKFRKKLLFLGYYISTIYIVGIFIKNLVYFNIEYRFAWLIAIFIISFFNFIFVKFIAFKDF